MANNLHRIKTLCFVFDAENDLILLQQYGAGKYARLHSGVDSDCLFAEDTAASCKTNLLQKAGIQIAGLKLRGILKTIDPAEGEPTIYFVYEAGFVHGNLQQNAEGRLKWVEVLNMFNLKYIPFVKEIIAHLLDGESFFEAFFELSESGEIVRQQIHPEYE
ncbi:MAG: hypothetical protein A2W90_24105 [Bacteroidetes bacterium GWF2_42_66]|nr:MAG: hypothetical protein A2W92_15215 [Bacteroidetes bacterium GWA2_42_15]OFX97987.1 MAG: hypothetical protein A2W89_08000 [Bacteroidetes bacterium GWE2_42_39]OFY45776.1 MAG: hypothetical protein A2W90_24105 [Bacteroidetes bacterium GWF2_42_66]HBL74727.1 hypothetical protein [Prolixibacteraceae bacterium]HCR89395.1 hypothetical protein [Prolixibacteraceae bacterium]